MTSLRVSSKPEARAGDLLGLQALDGEGVAVNARGELVRVLEDWCPPFEGYFLYYLSRRHQSPALRALVAALRV